MVLATLDCRPIEEITVPGKRLSFDIAAELHTALQDAAIADGISISDRVRALVELWQSDPDMSVQVDQLARGLAAERRRKKAGQ